MALSRISNSSDILINLSRIPHAAKTSLVEMQCTRYGAMHQNRLKALHVTSVRRYPDPPTLPLPTNVSEIFANETGRFTPERSRDIAAPVLIYGKSTADHKSFSFGQPSKTAECISIPTTCGDSHVDSYDCFGAVSLSGTMQSNVPKPFCSSGKSMHLNMPGGQWARDGKYIAEDMQKSHYRSVRLPQLKLDASGTANQVLPTVTILRKLYQPNCINQISMRYSTNVNKENDRTKEQINLTKKERFQIMVRDYGITVVVVHIIISLISLGSIYTAVASGVDFTSILKMIQKTDSAEYQSLMNNTSAFLLAFTINKILVPIRISITLGASPFIVRKLRKIGILKPPKIKTTQSN
ncbi:uncharacterized protein LOC116428858 isoform X2 [Nomia melanderi]|uniref:uncharacterized protein LOC116428858 isoform X2 n=1 Tax=Nomia melanderi TaxID=2448451 RepID=UPI0013045E15|nr:uncharacterized protein LOC116428858 isoform X3 [Nomia melanderi]